MKFTKPLVPGHLVKRYKRFLADIVRGDGSMLTVHCPNPGAMMGLDHPGQAVWLSRSDNPKRKLSHTLEIVSPPEGGMVGINTQRPNAIVEEALLAGLLPELSPFETLNREVRYGRNSRIDILLSGTGGSRIFVEVKNAHLRRRENLAEFPDCVTKRGAKHLDELGDMVDEGHRAVMIYLIQRADVDRLAVATDLDPGYAAAFSRAIARGVEAIALACKVTCEEITVERRVPILTPPAGK